MKLLLSSVFGPYGVDDEYGEKENKMELFHNQVTREQGIFSYRFNHGSQGLYFLAENIDVPTKVLDFSTFKRFRKELKKGKIIRNIPYETQHGQGKIWFHHDHFSREESKDLLRLAFEIDYIRNGASLLRVIKTIFEGYLYCRNHPSELIRARSRSYKKRLNMTRYLLTAAAIFVQNRQSEILLKDIKKLFHLHFGKMNIFTFVTSIVMVFFSVKEYLRCRIVGDVRVPGTSCRKYRSNGFHEHEGQQVKVSEVTGAKIGNYV